MATLPQRFFLLLIIRSGWQVRTTTRPKANWTRNNKGLIRTTNPPSKISLDLWFHLSMDALWVLNGVVFMVLLLATGQWMRIVPTGWDVVPNALSAALQYASLSWPTENGWVNYNALQVLAYFTIVFIAAPLALVSGLRMSGAWPKNASRLNRAYPIELARAIHFPVMLYFVGFIIVHVALVFATGALRNLNHIRLARRRRLGRVLDLRSFAGGHACRLVPGPPFVPASYCLPDGQSFTLMARPSAATACAVGRGRTNNYQLGRAKDV